MKTFEENLKIWNSKPLIHDKSIARISSQMIYDHVFYAEMLQQMNRIYMDKGTMAVSITSKINLHICMDYVNSVPDIIRKETIAHEILHIINEHFNRMASFDDVISGNSKLSHQAKNICLDIAINQMLPNLYRYGNIKCTDEKCGHIEHVDQLLERKKKEHKCPKCGADGNLSGSCTVEMLEEMVGKPVEREKTAEYYLDVIKKDAQENPDKYNGDCPSCGGSGKQDDGQGGEETCPDCNGTGKASGAGWIEENAPDHAEQNNSNGTSDEVKREVVKAAVKEAQNKAAGNMPGDLEKLLGDLFKSKNNWKKLLQQFISNRIAANRQRTRKKRNRRTGVINPGTKKDFVSHLLFAIDVSGSMSMPEVEACFAEVKKAYDTTGTEITLVTFDTEIHYEKPFDGKLPDKLEGWGGTECGPVFKRAKELKVDGVIVLTDGGLFTRPEPPKGIPILWAITSGNQLLSEIDYGRKITVEVEGR